MPKKKKTKDPRKEAKKKLVEFGSEVLESIKKTEPPRMKVPSRSTSNILYDDKNRFYTLGEKVGTRTAANMRQVKKFAQTMCAAEFCRSLIDADKTATLREMYYTSEGWETGGFSDQGRSDKVVEDLESAFGVKREDLGLLPEEDGASIFGELVVDEGGMEVNATEAGRAGYTIPPTMNDVEFLECDAKKVLAVETMGMYHRLVQEEAWDQFDALVVALKGQPARATRRFLKRANEELGLPIHLFTDGDPFGFHIAMVVISGSAKLAYINHELAVPDAKFIGVTASDIEDYDLPTDKLRETDVKRLKQLLDDPRYSDDTWQSEIKKMLKIGKKAEQQAFSKYGLDYVVNEYLPSKLS
ncbi:DNA topoisomerase VI [candidate division MSBL1 archaeon SCGC-AAA833F18]|uniref:Type 2 DNA topoisomerase 6 subunit A n=2 Tax=candidate division MSBL1 TaxID=215777 RepID=A0A133VT79_9EURY|nr:DNA topoisomerase VI [candidate division MSBL1 archaeon SCGC-AAA261G05]KXB09655.1 DNA topoisomerase VI [candidate division MSBL1 archaeon SCGC-AAA833F18]